ncbi:phosphopantetheine-binding protein [Streptomyces sp. NPDC019990]|uniref:acyl carrier protein n=1 Tax=Streptomyces sp. NPDC019990 TaxID=3154693 RepID=UPI0033E11F66
MTTTVPPTEEIHDRTRSVLAARIGDAFADVPSDADLQQALGERYDSLTAMECISAIESEFGIEVDFVGDDVRFWFSSVERIVRFTQERLEDSVALGHGS